MKTITCSNRIYYSELSSEEANALHQDIQLYHAMMHTAYHLLCLKSQGIPFPFENSLEKEMKRRFHTNDYFPLSAIQEAKQHLSNDFANHENQKKALKAQCKAIEKKIKEVEINILKIDRQLKELFRKTKQGKQTEADYLLEVQQLRPERKRYKNRRSHLIYGLNRRKQKLEALQRKMKFTCFGGKKLARARTTVYAGQHETWLKAYQSARNRTMMIQGRRQGKFSNNLFQYHIEEGVLIYRCSSEKREIPLKIEFHQYKEELERAVRLPHNTPGKAVAYVLEDHGAYFIIKAIVEMEEKAKSEDTEQGVIGIDINVNHIAVSETDGCGNCVLLKTVKMPLDGKNRKQRKHQIDETVKEVVLECVRSHKPLVMEDLDFQKTKSKMRYGNRRQNKMLSDFATRKIEEAIVRRCWKEGYGVKKVNPANTSKIGKEKYSKRMGCTVHMAAAYVIARRGMGME